MLLHEVSRRRRKKKQMRKWPLPRNPKSLKVLPWQPQLRYSCKIPNYLEVLSISATKLYSVRNVLFRSRNNQTPVTVAVHKNSSLITRKPVFRVFDRVRHKPPWTATEASQRLEISDIETRDITLSRQRTTKARLRRPELHLCWSSMAYGRFSHDEARI